MDFFKYKLKDEELRLIYKEVALFNQDYSLNAPGCLKDEIFELLEKVGTLIFYPIKEESLWGIYVCKNEKHYFVLNSLIELEKQVFAAAHELAHSLDIAKVRFEFITPDLMTEYTNHGNFGDALARTDLIANRFAAEILVSSKKLIEKFEEIPNYYPLEVKAVLLSDVFLVPYKTIVKRFIETNIVKEQSEISRLLTIGEQEVKLIAERYECCKRNSLITNETRLGGYANKALTLFENELSTFQDLTEKLKLIGKTPDDFGIVDTEFDIYDFLSRASIQTAAEDDEGYE
jgi:Zn-dependent peptidase ImmA (M78 family)